MNSFNIMTDEMKRKMRKNIIKSEKQKHELLFGLCQNKNGDINMSKQIGKSNKRDNNGISFTSEKLKTSCGSKKPIGDFHTHPYSQSMQNLGEKAKDVYISGGDISHLGELSGKFHNNFTGCIGGKIKENGRYVNRVRCFDNETVHPAVMGFVRKQGQCKRYNKCTDKINGIRRCEYEKASQETAYLFDERKLNDRYSCRFDI